MLLSVILTAISHRIDLDKMLIIPFQQKSRAKYLYSSFFILAFFLQLEMILKLIIAYLQL